jgi:XTP/dITP diphosphohydrolase
MLTLIFATNNQNKVLEVKNLLHGAYHIRSLQDIGIDQEIAEPFNTLEANALEKALVIKRKTGLDCFAEDTGLFVTALNGEPGVKSARYAGEHCTSLDNILKLLVNMEGIEDRSAIFKTVFCLLSNDKQYVFEGTCKGTIIACQRGGEGFGYDPLFIPDGSSKTFAEMGLEKKNYFSHRKKAIEKLAAHLSKQELTDLKAP